MIIVVITNNGTGVLGTNTDNESYTIEMKIKFDSYNQFSSGLFSKLNATSGYALSVSISGILLFNQYYDSGASVAQSSTPLTLGAWYRIVATFDYATKTQKLYINGALVSTVTQTGTPLFSNGNTGLGTNSDPSSGYFKGQFNDFRIWNVVKNQEDVSAYTRSPQTVNTVPNLIAHFKFNQGIANANNAGLITLANEVVGGPVGTLQNFALNGSTSNWTKDTTANETVVLGVTNFNLADTVKIYPNPSTGIFTISIEEDALVEIHDMLGKVTYTSKVKVGNNIIDISNYQSGIYLLNVKTEKGSVTKKMIIE